MKISEKIVKVNAIISEHRCEDGGTKYEIIVVGPITMDSGLGSVENGYFAGSLWVPWHRVC